MNSYSNSTLAEKRAKDRSFGKMVKGVKRLRKNLAVVALSGPDLENSLWDFIATQAEGIIEISIKDNRVKPSRYGVGAHSVIVCSVGFFVFGD